MIAPERNSINHSSRSSIQINSINRIQRSSCGGGGGKCLVQFADTIFNQSHSCKRGDCQKGKQMLRMKKQSSSSTEKSNIISMLDSNKHSLAQYNNNSNYNSKLSRRQTHKQLAFFAFFILAILILCIEFKEVSSLNCYHCSSVDNPGCDESFSGRANYTNTTNCEAIINRPAKVCRKIVQYIEDKKVVIRSCGYIDEHEEKDRKAMCYKRSGTFAIMMESCNCYEDNCNHSASLVPSKSLLVTLISGGLIMIYFSRLFNMQHLSLLINKRR